MKAKFRTSMYLAGNAADLSVLTVLVKPMPTNQDGEEVIVMPSTSDAPGVGTFLCRAAQGEPAGFVAEIKSLITGNELDVHALIYSSDGGGVVMAQYVHRDADISSNTDIVDGDPASIAFGNATSSFNPDWGIAR